VSFSDGMNMRDRIDIEPNADFARLFLGVRKKRMASAIRGIVSTLISISVFSFCVLALLSISYGQWKFFPLFSFIIFWVFFIAGLYSALSKGNFFSSPYSLAREIELFEGRGNLISSALDFTGGSERLKSYSPYLLKETVRRATEELKRLNVQKVFLWLAKPHATFSAFVLLLIFAITLISVPDDVWKVIGCISDPTLSFRKVRGSNIVNVSGDKVVIAGDDVLVEGMEFGTGTSKPELKVSYVPGVWKTFSVEQDTIFEGPSSFILYRKLFTKVDEEFEYYFQSENSRSKVAKVRLLHRPVINSVRVVQIFPRYTSAKPETIRTLAGRLVSMKGAEVLIEAQTSKPVVDGALKFLSGDTIKIKPTGQGFKVSFKVERTDSFYFDVIDSVGLRSEGRIVYALLASEDRCPGVEIIAPEDGELMPKTQELDIAFRAYDDFGISSLKLYYRREGKWSDYRVINLPLKDLAGGGQEEAISQIEAGYHWSLRNVNLFPGDRLLYFLEVTDNNTATGPCSARSEARTLLMPSLSQIYAKVNEEESAQGRSMEEIIERGEELEQKLRHFSERLKSQRKMDWSMRAEGEELLAIHNELKEKIDRAIDQLEETLSRYRENALSSKEIIEKLQELRSIMDELRSTELKDALDRLRSILKEVPEEEVLKELNNLEVDSKKLLEGLKRTVELFKRLMRQQRLEEFARRTEELIEQQTELRDSTAEGDTSGVSSSQRELSRDAKELERKIEDFAKAQEDSSVAREIDSLLARLNSDRPSEKMRKAADQLDSKDTEGALCTQNSTISQLLNLYSTIGQCKMSLGLVLDREMLNRVEKETVKLVELSGNEESLAFKLEGGTRSADREDFLEEQISLKEALAKVTGSLFEIASKSFIISSRTFASLGLAQSNIQRALIMIQEEDYRSAGRYAARSCEYINRAVVDLLSSSSSASSSGQATEMMQKLFQEQLSLSNEIQRLLERKRSGGLSMEEMASLSRLAAKQRMMEEALKQIAQEAKAREELLGSVDDIVKSMREAADKLERGELDEELVRREERILSRMLESQRSLRERGFKKERVSRTAGNVRALFEGQRRGIEGKRETILKAVQRGMMGPGPEEYRDLIRSYFRALSRKVRGEVERGK